MTYPAFHPGATEMQRPGCCFVAGHFGELLQGLVGGQVALVTLPAPGLGVRVWRRQGVFALHQPGGLILDAGRARLMLRRLQVPLRGQFVLRADLPPGGGAGVSTAALVALARAAGVQNCDLAAACLAVEGASDPLMFPDPGRLLWASRAGRVLDQFPPLPRFEVLGGFVGSPQRTDPGDDRFPVIDDLVAAWSGADAAGKAALAIESARRTLVLRGPAGDPTAALARGLGAAGYAIAHTGSARALLFLPGKVPAGAAAALRRAGFATVRQFRTGGCGDA